MATTFERFWNDKDGKEYGLIGQSTTNPNKGVAVQVDEATGETLVRIPATSPVTVVQSNPTLLKCEPTQTDGTKLSARVHRDDDTGIASEATVATLATQATAASIKTAVELIDDAVFSQGDASGKFLAGGAEIQDPTTLPADGIAGKVRRILADLKGILFTRAMLGVAGAAVTPVAGVTSNLPETKTTTYDAGMVGTFVPLVDGVTVTTVVGAVALVTVIGRSITQTVVLGASTNALLDAAWAANATAVALCTFTCTAGTVAAGYAGVAIPLWTARTVAVGESLMKMSDGTVAPLEGDAATGALKTYQRGVNTAVDAQQTMAVVAAPKGVNGPADLLVSAAQADAGGAGTAYDTMTLEFANYDTLTVDGYWACAGAETYQIDILQRLDAADAWKNVNALFLPAGVLGVPSVNGNFSVGTSVRVQWNKVLVRRTKVGNTACPVAFRYMVGR